MEKAKDLAHPLQREAFASHFANHGHFDQLVQRIQTAMPFPFRLDYAPLVPPLQLAGCEPGQSHHLVRCKTVLHEASNLFETIVKQNVSNILGARRGESSRDSVEIG